VEQKLTWDLAAVKRIDDIVIGSDGAGAIAHSHRTYPLGLRPYREEKVVKKEGEDPAKGPNPFGAPKIAIEKGGKDRYLEVSEQVRRLPVAVSLIVDQQHVDRVQASFANSHFRFLTTQVLLNRYPYSVSPQLNKVDAGKGPALPMGGFPMGVRPVPVPVPMFPMGGMAPVSPMAPADAGGGGSRTSDDLETNMELVIYGIITLYERYPPRKIEAPPPA
jgi:hypothetical protein